MGMAGDLGAATLRLLVDNLNNKEIISPKILRVYRECRSSPRFGYVIPRPSRGSFEVRPAVDSQDMIKGQSTFARGPYAPASHTSHTSTALRLHRGSPSCIVCTSLSKREGRTAVSLGGPTDGTRRGRRRGGGGMILGAVLGVLVLLVLFCTHGNESVLF